MKWLKRLLGRKPERKVWDAKTQCGQILRALCEGQTIGGKEACELIRSHNGLRRLNQVRARLRAHQVRMQTIHDRASTGHFFKLTWLWPADREQARQLLKR